MEPPAVTLSRLFSLDELRMNGRVEGLHRNQYRLIPDPPGEAAENMAIDLAMAESVRNQRESPALRIYSWSREAISLGRRLSVEDLPASWRGRNLPILWRPTGGGAIRHTPEETTYALAGRREHLSGGISPSWIPRLLHETLHHFLMGECEGCQVYRPGTHLHLGRGSATLCFEHPVCGDLLYRGRKVAGSALRVWRDGWLLQGTIQDFPVEKAVLVEGLISSAERLLRIRLTGAGKEKTAEAGI